MSTGLIFLSQWDRFSLRWILWFCQIIQSLDKLVRFEADTVRTTFILSINPTTHVLPDHWTVSVTYRETNEIDVQICCNCFIFSDVINCLLVFVPSAGDLILTELLSRLICFASYSLIDGKSKRVVGLFLFSEQYRKSKLSPHSFFTTMYVMQMQMLSEIFAEQRLTTKPVKLWDDNWNN